MGDVPSGSCEVVKVESCKSGAPALNYTYLNKFEYRRIQKPSVVHKLTNTTLPSLLMTSLCSSAHMVTFKEGQNKDTVIAQQRRMCVNRRVANYQAHVLQLTQMKALFSVEQIASFPTHLKASSSPSVTYSKNYTHEHGHIRINYPFNYQKAPTHTHTHTQIQPRSCMLLTASGQKVLLKTVSQEDMQRMCISVKAHQIVLSLDQMFISKLCTCMCDFHSH